MAVVILSLFPRCPKSPGWIRAPRPRAHPARDSFSLRFSLPDDRPAKLQLFDVAGRVRRSLEVRGAGEHVTRWEQLRELPPGLYLARLSWAHEQRTVRVVVAH